MSKILKTAVVAVLIIILVIGGIRLIKIRKEQVAGTPPPEKPVYAVKGTKIKQGTLTISNHFVGFIRPVNTVDVSPKTAGYIKKIHVKTGQKVKKGDLLVSIDDTQIKNDIKNVQLDISTVEIQLSAVQAKKEALKTDLQTKKHIYERNKRLYEKKAISEEALEKSLTAYRLALSQYEEVLATEKNLSSKIQQLRNRIKTLQNELSYLQIRSPVDGIVQRINIREGNLATLNKPVLSVESSGMYEVIVKLPPDFPVKEGDTAVVDFNGNRKTLKISMVCPSASPEALKVIKLRLHDKPPSVPSNSYLNVYLEKKVEGLTLPVNAVLTLTDGSYVLVYKSGKFEKVPVKLIASNGRTAVIQGENLHEGMVVAVAEESKLRLLAAGRAGKIIQEKVSDGQ
ncbi:efflux RND transporter periplasmic adaptor subunit [Persephonella sp.]